MNNEVIGRVVAVPPAQTGMGQRGPWGRQTVVIEYESGRYTQKLALDNSNKYEEFGKLRPGQRVKFHYDVTSREYNGRYYTSVNCFDWEVEGTPQQPQQYQQAPSASNNTGGLPF